jgi:cytochrome c nitrite reductase small subunit
MRSHPRLAVAALAFCLAAGAAAGVGGYTFVYAKGASYLTNDPGACANCHVMQAYLDGWIKSSHRHAAVCNDCHTPPDFAGKYMTKGLNGFWHSYAFTTGRFPDVIRITPRNHAIAEASCLKCHADIVEAVSGPHGSGERISCVRCHGSVGHPR